MPETRIDREQQTRTERETGGDVERRPLRRDEGGLQRSSPFDYAARPFEMLRRMWTDMDRMLTTPSFRGFEGIWSPQIEVFQRENRLVVRADLPGMKKDDIKVELRDNLLTIEGERRQEREENREGYFHSERSYGRFYRSIPLPEGTTGENVDASFHDGVLEVTMDAPKRREPDGRKIEIRGAS